ncbi:MAG: XisI protein [Phormidesmis sp.]
MEGISYSKIVQEVLRQHLDSGLSNEIELQFVCDTQNHHYQLIHLGWKELKRVYGCIAHVDIKDDKIWIQQDGTEVGIANELVEAGVPKKDIVLAFHAPYKRKFTEFAVG